MVNARIFERLWLVLDGFPILNPMTPLSYLQPETARQISLASHIAIGSLAVLIWDVLHNISADYKLLFNHPLRPSTLVYMFSRLASLGYSLWYSIYYTAPIGHCHKHQRGVAAFYPAAISASTLLFFFRVRIIYDGSHRIVVPFLFLWLSVVGGTLTAAFGLTGEAIGPTQYCFVSGIKSYVSAGAIAPLVYDTAVFVAITYRLSLNPYSGSSGGRRTVWRMLTGSYLPGVSRTFIKDGQSYYAVTVVSNLLAVVMIFMTSVPVAYRTIFSAPNLALINIMACRVFRSMVLGVFEQSPFTTSNLLSVAQGHQYSYGRNSKNSYIGGVSDHGGIRNPGSSVMLPVVFRHHHTHTVTDNGDCQTDLAYYNTPANSSRGHSRTDMGLVPTKGAIGASVVRMENSGAGILGSPLPDVMGLSPDTKGHRGVGCSTCFLDPSGPGGVSPANGESGIQ